MEDMKNRKVEFIAVEEALAKVKIYKGFFLTLAAALRYSNDVPQLRT